MPALRAGRKSPSGGQPKPIPSSVIPSRFALYAEGVFYSGAWMPADPARFGQTPTALAPTASNATQTP